MRVKEICQYKGITLRQLAEKVGVSPESISRAIGEKGNPTLSTMKNIADALGVSVAHLTEDIPSNAIICPNCGAEIRLTAEKV